MATYYDVQKRNQTLPGTLLEKAGEGLRAANRAVATGLENLWYPKREAIRQRELDDAIEEERRNVLANDARIAEAAKAKRLGGVQTETASYGPDGNLVVTPGGEAGQPGVLSYYAPSDAKFSQTGNNARVSFGQGNNYVEFDATKAPAGAVDRIKDTIANNPEFYRQGKKYVNDRGDAMPFANDMDARMYAAQGGGNSFAADPQSTLKARLASYAAASDLINQTRAEARGVDPRLAAYIDKAKPGALRAATAAMRQQDADPESFRKQMMLEQAKAARGGLGKAAQPAKIEDAYKANLDWANGLLAGDEAKAFALDAQAKGYVFRNQAEVAAAIKEWRARKNFVPEGGFVSGDGAFDFRPVDANVSWKYNPFGSDWVEVLTPGGQVVRKKVSREQAMRTEQELARRYAQ